MTYRNEFKERVFSGVLGGSVPIDVKAVGDEGEIEGYAAIFSHEDHGGDTILPGAFEKSLREYPASKVKMLWQHDPTQVIGMWDQAYEDKRGLYVKGKIFVELEKGREAHYLLKSGAVEGLSIGYRAQKYQRDPHTMNRTLEELLLREVSVVTFPMQELAGVTLVKHDGGLPSEREFERFLTRDAGFSAQQAKAIIAHGYKSLTTARDAGDGDDQELAKALRDATQRIRG